MQEYISLVKTVQTIGLNVGDRYSFYVVVDQMGYGASSGSAW